MSSRLFASVEFIFITVCMVEAPKMGMIPLNLEHDGLLILSDSKKKVAILRDKVRETSVKLIGVDMDLDWRLGSLDED